MDTAHPGRGLDGQAHDLSLLLKRNCSITPAGLWRVFALIALVTMGIATGFACLGAWMILPFAGVELLVLAGAFLAVGRHATDCEQIEVAGGQVRIEVRESEHTVVHEFDASRARVELRERRGQVRVWLRVRDRLFEVGRHLDEASRTELAAELRRRLRGKLGEGTT